MKLKFKVAGTMCVMNEFQINDVGAYPNDFGEGRDHGDGDTEEKCDCSVGCSNQRFTRKESTPKILAKYSITQKEYNEICKKLEEGLSFGECDACN
jgi:hypothetical protein